MCGNLSLNVLNFNIWNKEKPRLYYPRIVYFDDDYLNKYILSNKRYGGNLDTDKNHTINDDRENNSE